MNQYIKILELQMIMMLSFDIFIFSILLVCIKIWNAGSKTLISWWWWWWSSSSSLRWLGNSLNGWTTLHHQDCYKFPGAIQAPGQQVNNHMLNYSLQGLLKCYIYAEYHECINEKYLNMKITVSSFFIHYPTLLACSFKKWYRGSKINICW